MSMRAGNKRGKLRAAETDQIAARLLQGFSFLFIFLTIKQLCCDQTDPFRSQLGSLLQSHPLVHALVLLPAPCQPAPGEMGKGLSSSRGGFINWWW